MPIKKFNGAVARALFALIVVFSGCGPSSSSSRTLDSNRRGQTFTTAEEGLAALKAAFASGDPEQLVGIFGEAGRDIIVTGDAMADSVAMRRASVRLSQRAELLPVKSEEYANEQWYKVRFGTEGWLMRIPLVSRGQGWYFETRYAEDAARETRQAINEVEAVDTLWSIMIAQREYKRVDHDSDGVLEYAARLISSDGKRDGLYWPAASGTPMSPLDRLVGEAVSLGYTRSEDKRNSYEGYYYRVLTGQGRYARRGRYSYLDDKSNMTRGFAVLAYPVSWNKSGLRSFMISDDGKAFKKDMGFKTDKIGREMTEFNPDPTWALIEHPENYSSRSDSLNIK